MVIVVPEVVVEGGVEKVHRSSNPVQDEGDSRQLLSDVLELLRAFRAIQVQRIHRAHHHIVGRIVTARKRSKHRTCQRRIGLLFKCLMIRLLPRR